MVEGDSKSTDVQSACVLQPPLWLVHLVNRQKGGRAVENEAHDRRAICQLPNLARLAPRGYVRRTVSLSPIPDVSPRMLGIVPISSGLPSGPDVAGVRCISSSAPTTRFHRA